MWNAQVGKEGTDLKSYRLFLGPADRCRGETKQADKSCSSYLGSHCPRSSTVLALGKISNRIRAAHPAILHVVAQHRCLAIRAGLDTTGEFFRRREQATIHQLVETLRFVSQLHKIVHSGAVAFPLKLGVAYCLFDQRL